MARKRVTEVFPFLLPLRRKQRKFFYYMKMYFDKNKYAVGQVREELPWEVTKTKSLLLNDKSGFDMKYQENKVYNLKLASRTIDKVLIRPGEVFSFWQLVRRVDKYVAYKDGLVLVNGKIVPSYGGGLCQISNMLFWMFIHSPLTIVERHGHRVESFPSTDSSQPIGVDATISEGWLDIKMKNETNNNYQITISFDDTHIHGMILSDNRPEYKYEIFNKEVKYIKRNKGIYQKATVNRRTLKKNKYSQETKDEIIKEEELYKNSCEIGYEIDISKEKINEEEYK